MWSNTKSKQLTTERKMTEATHIEIYKDGWIPSRPWNADLVFEDGSRWKSWQSNFSTQKAMLANISGGVSEAALLPIHRVSDA